MVAKCQKQLNTSKNPEKGSKEPEETKRQQKAGKCQLRERCDAGQKTEEKKDRKTEDDSSRV